MDTYKGSHPAWSLTQLPEDLDPTKMIVDETELDDDGQEELEDEWESEHVKCDSTH